MWSFEESPQPRRAAGHGKTIPTFQVSHREVSDSNFESDERMREVPLPRENDGASTLAYTKDVPDDLETRESSDVSSSRETRKFGWRR